MTKERTTMAYLGFLSVLAIIPWYCSGVLVMTVSPYPARIYQSAPPGVTVVTVRASDNQTGRVTSLRLENRPDARLFKINSIGVIKTNAHINYRVGRAFRFSVFAHQKDQLCNDSATCLDEVTDYRQVYILVSNRNLYPPTFANDSYSFPVYRFGVNDVIGHVTASDKDEDAYNKHFTIYAPYKQLALNYVDVEKSGKLTLIKSVPETTSTLNLKILAVDNGSPQLTGTTTVTLDFLNIKQPDKFCISSRPTSIKLCWKNPMPEQHFRGFTVTVRGAITRTESVPLQKDRDEMCYTLNGAERGKQYIFKVTVDSSSHWRGEDYELVKNHTGASHLKVCETENFSKCSYLYPCSDNGKCVSTTQTTKGYRCVCDKGWQGEACNIYNICDAQSPCRNGARCQFKGHQKYECQCRVGYEGTNCQHLNQCRNTPCANRGTCRSYGDGTFSCQCSTGWKGSRCQEADPCSQSPCVIDQGTCHKISDKERRCDCEKGYYGDACEMENKCIRLDNPCRSNAKCFNTSTGFYCECPPGTSGTICQNFDPCYIQPCQNGGECTSLGNAGFHCQCPSGFHGSECQHRGCDIDCHNGTCHLDSDTQQPRCSCSDGFLGDFCEFYDVCKLSVKVCHGNGDCISDVDLSQSGSSDRISSKWKTKYSCLCFEGYYGMDCQHFNSCSLAPTNYCQNGGTCKTLDNNKYTCECPAGYAGRDCSSVDLCHHNPCRNGGQCTSDVGGVYCKCMDGWWGQRCEFHGQECTPLWNPCENNGRCFMKRINTTLIQQFIPTCECLDGFTGRYCRVERPCHQHACVHGFCKERSLDTDGSTVESDTSSKYICLCNEGYTGPHCDVSMDRCEGITCYNRGTCYQGICSCMPGFTGDRCRHEIPDCIKDEPLPDENCECHNGKIVCLESACRTDEEPLRIRDGSIYCAKILFRVKRRDMTMRCCHQECQPYTPDCNSRTHCSEAGVHDQTCFYFQFVCPSQGSCIGYSQLDMSCSDLSAPGDNGWVKCASGKLNVLASADPQNLGVDQVALYGKMIEDLKEAALDNTTIAQLVMDAISTLATVNVSVSLEAEAKNKTNLKLRSFINEYSASVALDDTESHNISTDVFTILAKSFSTRDEDVDFVLDSIGGEQVPMSINLPKKVLASMNARRLQFVGYRKSQLFISPNYTLDSNVVDRQAVISATVTNHILRNLTEPVTVKLPKIKDGENHTCVFWDPDESQWSTIGVVTLHDTETGQVVCQSNHLTSFAVLLSPRPEAVHSEKGLTYITYAGCAISIICLLITLLTYGLFKCLHGEKSGKILLHLCLALLLLNAIFLVGTVDVSDYEKMGCTFVALLLHYFVLASLMWMLVEAVEMYQALITVFAKYERLYIMKRCIVAWGIPALIVAITAAVDIDLYGSKRITEDGEVIQICFLVGGSKIAYYVSLLTPAAIIIVINTVVFVLVARVILKPRFQQQMDKETSTITPAQVRGALTVMFLLGITWVFGPLAIGKATVVFSYIFCICNSLQGCLIFVFRCLFNPEARLAWTQLIKTGTFKRRRGPIKSAYTESSSSKACPETITSNRRISNSASTQMSTANTSSSAKTPLFNKATGSHLHPHQLHNTNGWHPNLNGLRRENGHVISNPLSSGFDLQPSDSADSDNGPSPSQSETKINTIDILPPDSEKDGNFQDELTRL